MTATKVYINSSGIPTSGIPELFTPPGLRVIFWFFLMTQKEHALRHGVVAATAPGVATSYAFYCEPSAFEYAVLAQGLDGVL